MNGESKLNTNSYITLGLGITIIGAVIGGTFWLSNQFSDLKSSQTLAAQEVKSTREKLELRLSSLETAKITDRWTGVDMFKWAVRLQRDNPSIKVPEPSHQE